MTEQDLQRALQNGMANVRLSQAARAAILKKTKEAEPVKKKISMGLVLAMILAILTTAALATAWDIMDILERSVGPHKVLSGAQKLVQHPLAQTENDYAVYTVKEAIYDGRAAYLMVEIAPRDEHVFLLGETTLPDDRVDYHIPGGEYEGMTFAEYAASCGCTALVTADVHLGDMDYVVMDYYQDGKLILLVNYEASGDVLSVALECWASPADAARSESILRFELTASGTLWEKTAEPALLVEEWGVCIDRVTITGTALSTYVQVEYTAEDMNLFAGSMSINLCDANGDIYPRGAMSIGGSQGIAEKNGDRLQWFSGSKPLENAPEKMMLELGMFREGGYVTTKVPVEFK